MHFSVWFLPLVIVGSTVLFSIPVGYYLGWVMDGRYHAPGWLKWVEQRFDTGPQDWKQYVISLLLFNTVLFVAGFGFLCVQGALSDGILNPDNKGMLAPTTIFNTATSFLTNTNLQHYSGEQHLSYWGQLTTVLWNMFVSAAVGLCALCAVIRGLRGDKHIGNYYLDMWRSVVYVFLPFSLVMGVVLLASGVPMTFNGAAKAATVEDGSMGKNDQGEVNPQVIARGPVAAIMPIKHLGTNGGGFFGANSAHPYENPSAWTNYLECMNFLLFPFSLVVMFGFMLKNLRHAAVIYGVMLSMMTALLVWAVYWDALKPNPAFAAQSDVVVKVKDADGREVGKEVDDLGGLPVGGALGNTEGKELRFGTSAGPTFATLTTCIACGSVNCTHDSLNPLAGIAPFTGMWLNCIFGGKGVGLINVLIYLIVGVFLSGLMVGRTPEYLGKKVEAREMKLAMLAMLIHPIMILGPAGLFAATSAGRESINNPGAHGFSEVLYEFSSASANNGSEFGGLQQTYGLANNKEPAPYAVWWDAATGIVMLVSRFIPIVAPIALAGGLACKKLTPFTVGTLRTDTVTFGFVLLGTIMLVGALLFLPAAALGPMAEHLGPIPFGR